MARVVWVVHATPAASAARPVDNGASKHRNERMQLLELGGRGWWRRVAVPLPLCPIVPLLWPGHPPLRPVPLSLLPALPAVPVAVSHAATPGCAATFEPAARLRE